MAFVHLPVQENSQGFVVAQKHVISSIVSRKIPTVIRTHEFLVRHRNQTHSLLNAVKAPRRSMGWGGCVHMYIRSKRLLV